MSGFKHHSYAGIAAGCLSVGGGIYYGAFTPLELALGFGTTYVFSLIPDLDVKSKPSFYFYSILLVYLGYAWFTAQYKLGLIVAGIGILPQVVKHRGIMHSGLFALLLPASAFILYFNGVCDLQISVYLFISGLIGYCAHLLLDA